MRACKQPSRNGSPLQASVRTGTVLPPVIGLRAANPEAAAGPVATTDLFYDAPPPPDGALAVEMEAATVFQVARRRGATAACVLGVSDELADGGRERVDEEALERLGEAVGRAGAAAFGL